HWLAHKYQPQVQQRTHVALLAVSLLTLPISPRESWQPTGAEDPPLRILVLLTMTMGLPYFLLSSTSPLLQAWYARTRPGVSPYRFYALSNSGSLLGLLSYPLLVEPTISRVHQAVGWSIAYSGVAVLCALIALRARVVSARPVAQAAGLGLGSHGLCPGSRLRQRSPLRFAASLWHRFIRLLHGLPRRTGASEAPSRPPDLFLLHGGLGRGDRGMVCCSSGAAAVLRLV